MILVFIVLIITVGFVCYHLMQEETYIKCSCGAELRTKSTWEIGTFQTYHFTCR